MAIGNYIFSVDIVTSTVDIAAVFVASNFIIDVIDSVVDILLCWCYYCCFSCCCSCNSTGISRAGSLLSFALNRKLWGSLCHHARDTAASCRQRLHIVLCCLADLTTTGWLLYFSDSSVSIAPSSGLANFNSAVFVALYLGFFSLSLKNHDFNQPVFISLGT